MIRFNDLDFKAIYNEDQNLWLTEEVWTNIRKSKPEGFYLVGFPSETNQLKASVTGNRYHGLLQINPMCIPIEQIEQNVGGTIETIRFQFNLTSFDETISRVLEDTGYDWYWNMDAQKISLINRKSVFDIRELDILNLVSQFGSASGLNETSQLGFGQDVVPDPTRFRVLGGHQEGVINSELLSPIDGLDTTLHDGNLVFTHAWSRLSIGIYDAVGFNRTFTTTAKEIPSPGS